MERRDFLAGSSLAMLVLGLPQGARAAAAAGDAALYAAMDQIFYDGLLLNPTGASSLGLDKGVRAGLKSRLDDYGEGGRVADTLFNQRALKSMQAFGDSGLSAAGRRNRDNVIYDLNQSLVADRFGIGSVQRPYPITQNGGAYFGVPNFLDSQHNIETADDCEAYLARLAAFPVALDDNGEWQRIQAARGYLAPGWSLDLALGQMKKLRAPAPEASGMAQSLANRAGAKGIAGDWQGRAAAIVRDGVYPALDRQIALIEKLRRTTRAGDGLWRVPRGGEIYAAALTQGTTTTLSPDEVHKIGLTQVAELTARLEVILAKAGFTKGSIGSRLTALNTSADQLYANTDAGRADLLTGLNEGVAKMRALLPKAFNDIPDQPLEIRRVPVDIQDGASNGYYYRAPLDGSRPAIYWINLKDTADWPRYQLPSLTYHEGVPGHHLQGGYAQTGGELPMLLRNNFISAYGEGWALYAEQLADELGGYSGIEQAGYLQSFLFRAARLVVDTGLHAKRWSREKATDYLVETTGFTRPRSLREVERYCTSAGQACSYKIGHNMWVKLRERAQQKLGDRFTLGWFHDVLKEGVMPLAMLEKRVDERIAEKLAG